MAKPASELQEANRAIDVDNIDYEVLLDTSVGPIRLRTPNLRCP
ncbi:MAG: hypothetical protein O3A37_07820 [Planctomycetota bacterium]|jgi:hypothetical protein|nr:hypothetical protein [Planctomycetota bacterium]